MCVPVEKGEAFGSYIIEAMAAGVPVVQPNAGAFPELIEATGGGVIYDDLVATLKALLLDPDRLRKLGARGREVVHERFGIETMAANMMKLYSVVEEQSGKGSRKDGQ
jgi:glycosyltransferase involved in cell wall biosynthesis